MDSNEQLLNFCKNVKSLRQYCKLSKTKMSKLLGISVNSLTKIENGKIPERLNCYVLVRIYNIFGIKMSEIFTDNSNKCLKINLTQTPSTTDVVPLPQRWRQ